MSVSFTSRLRGRELSAWLLVVAAAFLAVAPFLLTGYDTSLLTKTLIFALFAAAFNLLYGYTGLLSFGHAMFIAASGYTVAKVIQVIAPALNFGSTFGGASPLFAWVFAIIVGVVVAGIVAVFIGYLSVRLEEIYFAIITLAFSMAIYVIANQDTIGSILGRTFTNGSDGLTFVMGTVDLFGTTFRLVDILDPVAYYYLTLIVFAVGMYGLWRIVRSPFGMACQAIRENPERASALGINVQFHQWMAFIVSGIFSGLAGAVFVVLKTHVTPDYAHWTFSAQPVIMTVIGGPYTFLGPVIGAFTYEYLRDAISNFAILEQYWQFSFGVLLLVVVLFFNNGVAGGLQWLAARVDEVRDGE